MTKDDRMAKKNAVAREILWPTNANILVRVVFLYVGQGASAIVFFANGAAYDVWVVDINLDSTNSGIDVPRLIADLLNGQDLAAFANTHPHNDHLCGVSELSEKVKIKQVLHSGHIPSKKYGSRYADLQKVIKKVKDAGGSETILEGSRSPVAVGEAYYHCLAPASHVTDEVNEEEADARRARIHEQCGVLKFGKDRTWIIIVGDADRAAFENHITKYHQDRIASFALGASHHGSRSFFRENEGDEPYLGGLKTIDPDFVFVSAPTQEESQHDHPHDDAMELYEEHSGADNVHHTGEDRCSFIVDIFKDGTTSGVTSDDGRLSEAYALGGDDDGSNKSGTEAAGPFVRPTSPTGDVVPRKYG
jgi:competence protein ComEC